MTVQIGFGGGCHWCTEATFQSLKGVRSVEQGWIASNLPYDQFSEAVIVQFDPKMIPLDVLVDVHLRTHASQKRHSMRSKYRSAIYTFGTDQQADAQSILERLSNEFDPKPVTEVLPHRAFKPSPDFYQNYYQTRPDRPFCRTYIDPKLAKLRREFAAFVDVADKRDPV